MVARGSQILNIDKADTSDYVRQTKASFNFNGGVEIDQQKQTLYDATNTAETISSMPDIFTCAGVIIIRIRSSRSLLRNINGTTNEGSAIVRWEASMPVTISEKAIISINSGVAPTIMHNGISRPTNMSGFPLPIRGSMTPGPSCRLRNSTIV